VHVFQLYKLIGHQQQPVIFFVFLVPSMVNVFCNSFWHNLGSKSLHFWNFSPISTVLVAVFFHFIQGGMEVSGLLSFDNRSSIATHSFDSKWMHLWHCLDMDASTMLHGTSELLASCRSHHV
jgi:hypothetical protein